MWWLFVFRKFSIKLDRGGPNDFTIGWQNLNPLLSHPNATLASKVRQARSSGENLNYVTLPPQAFEQHKHKHDILSYSLSCYSDILSKYDHCFIPTNTAINDQSKKSFEQIDLHWLETIELFIFNIHHQLIHHLNSMTFNMQLLPKYWGSRKN